MQAQARLALLYRRNDRWEEAVTINGQTDLTGTEATDIGASAAGAT